MRVLHITPSLEVSWGGPAQVVAGMASALVRHGVEVTVAATVPSDALGAELVETDARVDVCIFRRGRFSKLWNGFSRPLARFVAAETRDYDLVHSHEMWHYPEYVAYREAHRLGIPFVVSPHGCLAPLALANDRLLKIVYTRLVQRRILKTAGLLHALSSQEAEQIRAYGVLTHTEIIPSGTVLEHDPTVDSAAARARPAANRGEPFKILFLGRVVPNKGLELLIEALSELKRRRYNVHLVIAGPCSDTYRSLLSSLTERLGVADSMTFVGFVSGTRKSETFASADVFVLPSYTEGFSVAVIEAMAWRLPLVLTRQCSFPEAAESGAGLEVEPEVGQITSAIERLLKEPGEAARMGQQARSLVERAYTWDAIIPKIIASYRTLALSAVTRGATGP